jgi:hypothetical protein
VGATEGRKAEEIEITEEMIRAGTEAIGRYEAGDHEQMAYSCFKAMVSVWQQRKCRSPEGPQ